MMTLQLINDLFVKVVLLLLLFFVFFTNCRPCDGEDIKDLCPALRSPRHVTLNKLAQEHANTMARVQRQSHDGFNRRFERARRELNIAEASEICAESWDHQEFASRRELWKEAVKCWQTSPGHWRTASVRHYKIGVGLAKSSRGVWYMCLLAVDRPRR